MSDHLLPEAVLFDMDGTLVDTEPYWMATEVEMVERHGGAWTHEQGLQLVGNDLRTSARVILDQTGIAGTVESVVDELVSGVVARVGAHGAPWRPGALDLLRLLRDAGVPCALVTMSYAALSDAVAAAAPAGTFDVVVSGDQVSRGKPHPEPYLTAAERLGVDVTRCVAFEDSPVGATSALAAGARTAAIPLMVEIPDLPGLSRLRSLADVDRAVLHRLTSGEIVTAGR